MIASAFLGATRLKKLDKHTDATARQKVTAEIVSGVNNAAIDTETNLLEVLGKVHEISQIAWGVGLSSFCLLHFVPLAQRFVFTNNPLL